MRCLSDKIAETLRGELVAGRYGPGRDFPTVDTLRRRFGAGVTLDLPAIPHAVPNGSRLVIASAPAGATAPRMLTQGFGKIRVEPDPSDNSRVLLVATRNSGIMIMLQ